MIRLSQKEFTKHAAEVVSNVALRDNPIAVNTVHGTVVLMSNEMYQKMRDYCRCKLELSDTNLKISKADELLFEDILTSHDLVPSIRF